MNQEDLSMAINNLHENYITEAENFHAVKHKRIRRPVSRLAVAAIIAACLVLGSVAAYAGVHLYEWTASMTFHDGTKVTVSENAFFKEIPDGVPVVRENECMMEMTRAEVEKILGFGILHSPLSSESTVYNYWTAVNSDGKTVARVDLWCPDFICNDENKRINLLVAMLDVDAEDGYIYPFMEGTDAMGGKNYVGTYSLARLDTNAVIYSAEDMPTLLKAVLVFDNVQYTLSSYEYSLDEFLDVLHTLTL